MTPINFSTATTTTTTTSNMNIEEEEKKETIEQANQQPSQDSVTLFANDMDSYIKKVLANKNYLSENQPEKIAEMDTLADRAYKLLKAHPFFKLEKAKTVQTQMKQELTKLNKEMEDLKQDILAKTETEAQKTSPFATDFLSAMLMSQPLSELMFDCPGHIKRQEIKITELETAIENMDIVIRFQENPKQKLAEKSLHPLFDITSCMQDLLEAKITTI